MITPHSNGGGFMTEREKNLEAILKQLLTQHFYKTELEWGYVEGVSLKEKDIELYIQIAQELPEAILFHKE
jgi:hypothetical protein